MTESTFQGTYCGPAPDPDAWWTYWNFDPPVLAILAVLALATGRRPLGWALVLVLFGAFVSPLCAMAAALFSARVVHHVLLIAVAAPMLAMLWPAASRRGPGLPFAAATLVLWGWHLPVAYDLAMGNVPLYWVMQGSLLGSAALMWRAILQPGQPAPIAFLYVFAGLLQMALLGAILTLAPEQVYAIHALAPMDWGLTPLADQQLGGLIMWIPASVPYLVLGGLVARRGWQAMGQTS